MEDLSTCFFCKLGADGGNLEQWEKDVLGF